MSEHEKINPRRLRSGNVMSMVELSNLNFEEVAEKVNSFWESVSYDSAEVSLELNALNSETLEVGSSITVRSGVDHTFSVDANGVVSAKTVGCDLLNAKGVILNEKPGYVQDVGVLGEIAWTGEDFYGFTDNGWVSLTGSEPGSPGSSPAVLIGNPDSGDYGDGFFAWDFTVKLSNAMQDVNEKIKDLDENSGVQQYEKELSAGVNTDVNLGAVSEIRMAQVVFTAEKSGSDRVGGLVYVVNRDGASAVTDGGYWAGGGYAYGLTFSADVSGGNLVLRCTNSDVSDITFSYKTIEITK